MYAPAAGNDLAHVFVRSRLTQYAFGSIARSQVVLPAPHGPRSRNERLEIGNSRDYIAGNMAVKMLAGYTQFEPEAFDDPHQNHDPWFGELGR